MERKAFLSAASAAAVVGALAARPASAAPVSSNRNLYLMRDMLRLIHDDLSQDANDYGGNKARAMADLGSAINDINAALSYAGSH